MKLKLIAAAAVLAASGAANAAIDTGTDGSGDFIFSIWDASHSYTVDLNLLNTDFTSGVNAVGSYSFSLDLSADAVFQNFLSTANLSQLSWNLMAVESQGARTAIMTYNALPASGITNDIGRTMVGSIQSFENNSVNPKLASQGGDSAVFTTTESGYAGKTDFGCNVGALQNFNNCGTLANNSYASGLGLVSQGIATTGIAASTLAPVTDSGTAVRAYLSPSYNLVITAAVPEPETYAMLLAGLGLMGAIARRRQNKA